MDFCGQAPSAPSGFHKERHLVENLFLKLKNNRRFATRYEKKLHRLRVQNIGKRNPALAPGGWERGTVTL